MGERREKTEIILCKKGSKDKNKIVGLAEKELQQINKEVDDGIIVVDEVEVLDRNQEEVRLKVRLHNESKFKAKDNIQIHIKDMNSIYSTYLPKLCTAQKIELSAEEHQMIEISLTPEAFTIIDEKGDCYRDSNEFEIYISMGDTERKDSLKTEKYPIIRKIQFQNIEEEF